MYFRHMSWARAALWPRLWLWSLILPHFRHRGQSTGKIRSHLFLTASIKTVAVELVEIVAFLSDNFGSIFAPICFNNSIVIMSISIFFRPSSRHSRMTDPESHQSPRHSASQHNVPRHLSGMSKAAITKVRKRLLLTFTNCISLSSEL